MILEQFRNCKAVFLDVDGVLTNSTVLVNENGEQWRTFNIKDGYAIQLAIKKNILVFIITGGRSIGIVKRFESLGVSEIHLGVADKLALVRTLLDRYNIAKSDAIFIGDDMPDYECMQHVGIAVAPRDAVEEIKAISHYVSGKEGGKGVVRDVLEKVLKLQDLWQHEHAIKSI